MGYNGLMQVVRNGYTRILALTVLSAGLPPNVVGKLLAVVYGTSLCFFWLAETAGTGRGRKAVGLIAFALLGLGHLTIALSSSYQGLLVSSLLFGFGQATSTGLRTVWKDEVRALLRKNDHREAYRKAMLGSLPASVPRPRFSTRWSSATSASSSA